MRKFGLIGRNISYSFSPNYFAEKFSREKIDASYQNFDLQDLSEFPEILRKNKGLEGLNVTIPYKESILPFLDSIAPIASEIGAVNTIKISKSGKLTGFNTDYYGFLEAIRPFLKEQHKKALILGTGGASKAVVYALKSENIETTFVSRKPSKNAISYEDLDKEVLEDHLLIINGTPLGTFPNTGDFPKIPVQNLTPGHLVFDLIYNPPTTKLMELAKINGATVTNGLKMLELQAEKAWEIWQQD